MPASGERHRHLSGACGAHARPDIDADSDPDTDGHHDVAAAAHGDHGANEHADADSHCYRDTDSNSYERPDSDADDEPVSGIPELYDESGLPSHATGLRGVGAGLLRGAALDEVATGRAAPAALLSV